MGVEGFGAKFDKIDPLVRLLLYKGGSWSGWSVLGTVNDFENT